MKILQSLSAILLCILFVAACNRQVEHQPINDVNNDEELSIDEQLQSVLNDFELMGMAVMLLKDYEIAYEGYFGDAVHETGRKIDSNSVFRIASITKTVAAIALMQLVEQGLVDLDEDVNDYLDWELRNSNYPDEQITLRHLMGHTSGIRDGETYSKFAGDMIDDELQLKELFLPDGEYFSDDMFADHQPGEYFSYSNAAWGVVASVIELVSDQRFDRYAKDNIFDPLNMNASFNTVDIDRDNFAALYRFVDGNWVPQVDYYVDEAPVDRAYDNYEPGRNGLLFGPQGSLRANMPALKTLGQFLMNGGEVNGVRILESSSVEEMVSANWTYTGENGDTWDDFWMSYGLAVHRITNREEKDVIFPDREMIGHPGIAYGLLSDMYVDPKTGTGVIFITNGSKQEFKYGEKSAFYEVEEAVFDILYPYLKELESN